MSAQDRYRYKGDDDGFGRKSSTVWTVSKPSNDERHYPYNEAINLAGNGRYSIGLMATLSMAALAMAIDMFGFSVIVTGATCDFQLDLSQTNILLSMPFVGPIAMAYPWGYIADTKGRKTSLLIAMWGSFIVSVASAFAPNWVFMAVMKFISTSFCSCAQSVTYTLLGESSSETFRDSYMLIMTSVLDFSLAVYVVAAYFILNLPFSLNFGFITFTPWRLLTLVLALPLGISAMGMHFFYESPKFLVNAGRTEEAIEVLKNIWYRNGGYGGKYAVKKIFLEEEGNEKHKDQSLLQSLWDQIVPIFKPPLLTRSIQLYFLTAVIYSTNNSYFMWFPFLAEKFTSGLTSNTTDVEQIDGLCNTIVSVAANVTVHAKCSTAMEVSLVWASLAEGVSFVIVLLAITKFARRKKLLLTIILVVSCFSAIGAVTVMENMISFILFFGLLLNELCIGFIFSYFVDLYPTSYRGMAACLGVMVARASALGGVNILGAFMLSHCSITFYGCAAMLFCAILVTSMLQIGRAHV